MKQSWKHQAILIFLYSPNIYVSITQKIMSIIPKLIVHKIQIVNGLVMKVGHYLALFFLRQYCSFRYQIVLHYFFPLFRKNTDIF